MKRTWSNSESGKGKIPWWPALLILILIIGAGVWWVNYWRSPEMELRRETGDGKRVLAQWEKAIDPEKLRAWALPYLSDEAATNTDSILPPKEISQLITYQPNVVVDTETGSRFVLLYIQLGGFGFMEGIQVGNTNATVSQPVTSGLRLKWRDGIYYFVDNP